MDYSAYVRTLLSVFVGLGLGQLVQPLHRLARFRGTVRWDWLPLGWAFFAFVRAVHVALTIFAFVAFSVYITLFSLRIA